MLAAMILHSLPLRLCLLICLFSHPLADSGNYCPPITRGERSPYYPASTVGESVTMYCEFIVTNESARDLNITWSRIPSSLSYSRGRYTNQTMYSDDNSTANASILLWDLKSIPDIGTYTVRACSKCTCNESKFVLGLHQCNPDVVPQPNETYRRLAIAESSVSGPLPLSVFFVGSPDKLYNSAYWTHENKNLCLQAQNNVAVSCNRTVLVNCTFTANLFLLHPTHESSGNYSVKAISSDDDVSRISTVHLDIVRQPTVTCGKGPINVGLVEKSKLECKVYNYSGFVSLFVVKNIATRFNYSTSDKCTPQYLDKTIATCTVEVENLSRGDKYKMCVGYNSTVKFPKEPNCSQNIHVSYDDRIIYIVVIVFAVLLFVVFVVVCVCVCVCCRRRKGKCWSSKIPYRKHNNGSQSNRGTAEPTHTSVAFTETASNQGAGEVVERDCGSLQRQNSYGATRNIGFLFERKGHPSEQKGPLKSESAGVPATPSLPVVGNEPQPSGRNRTASGMHLLPKATIIYAQNPEIYQQIAEPEMQALLRQHLTLTREQIKTRYEAEVIKNERQMKENIRENKGLVAMFASFLTGLGITVVCDQGLEDCYVASKTQYMDKQIKDSDYVILVITPSFVSFLNEAPQEELIFMGPYLHNLIRSPGRNNSGKEIKIICVFLDRPRNIELVPTELKTGSIYELWQPFHLDKERKDETQNFVKLMLGKNQVGGGQAQ